MELVIVESPFAGETEIVYENILYARKAMADCLKRGEAPFASHLLYTQSGVLNDEIPEDRKLGIAAGLCWGRVADKTVVYIDRGISKGMIKGMISAQQEGRPIELRTIEQDGAQLNVDVSI